MRQQDLKENRDRNISLCVSILHWINVFCYLSCMLLFQHLSIFLCLSVCLSVSLSLPTHIHKYTWTNAHVKVHTWRCTQAHTIPTHAHTHKHTNMHTCTYTYTLACTHTPSTVQGILLALGNCLLCGIKKQFMWGNRENGELQNIDPG